MDRIEEIRKRVEAATPGPWEVEDYRRRQLDCAVGALNRIGGHLPTGICRQALNQIEAIGKRESS